MESYMTEIFGNNGGRPRMPTFTNFNNNNGANANGNGNSKTRKRRGLSSVFKSAANATKKAVRKKFTPSRPSQPFQIATATVFSIAVILKGLISAQKDKLVEKGFLSGTTGDEYEEFAGKMQQLFDATKKSVHCSDYTRNVLEMFAPVLKTLAMIDAIKLLEKGQLLEFKDLLVSAGAKCTVMQINDGSKRLDTTSSDSSGVWDTVYFGYLNDDAPPAEVMGDFVFAVEYSLLTQFSLLYTNGFIQLNKEWFAMNNSRRPRNIPREDIYKRIRSGCGLGEDLSKEEVLKELREQYYPAAATNAAPYRMSMANFLGNKNSKNGGGHRRRTLRCRIRK